MGCLSFGSEATYHKEVKRIVWIVFSALSRYLADIRLMREMTLSEIDKILLVF